MANVIRLDLNDKNESTIYLSDENTLPVSVDITDRVEHFGVNDIECKKAYRIHLALAGSREEYLMSYDDEDQRNLDLRYILNQIDDLLGVEREKEEF